MVLVSMVLDGAGFDELDGAGFDELVSMVLDGASFDELVVMELVLGIHLVHVWRSGHLDSCMNKN